MNKRPVVASPPWTPAEDEKLRALVALGERPATIAEQLQRSEEAVRHRFYKHARGVLLASIGRVQWKSPKFASMITIPTFGGYPDG